MISFSQQYLGSNSLTSLDDYLFNSLTVLQALSIHHSIHFSLLSIIFQKLNNNYLTSLPPSLFSNNRNILELNHNSSILYPSHSCFHFFSIYLHSNSLTSLPPSLFFNNIGLEYLVVLQTLFITISFLNSHSNHHSSTFPQTISHPSPLMSSLNSHFLNHYFHQFIPFHQ